MRVLLISSSDDHADIHEVVVLNPDVVEGWLAKFREADPDGMFHVRNLVPDSPVAALGYIKEYLTHGGDIK